MFNVANLAQQLDRRDSFLKSHLSILPTSSLNHFQAVLVFTYRSAVYLIMMKAGGNWYKLSLKASEENMRE